MTARSLSIDDLVAALADRAPVLLDVRDLAESDHGHIPGATILPRRRIEFRIEPMVRDRATRVVTVDGGEMLPDGGRDPRAALAAATLVELGYRDVQALVGGIAAWRSAGLPLVSGAQVSCKAFGRRVGDLESVPRVGVDTLLDWQRAGRRVALCDVRSAAEHHRGCVPGAVSLPGFEVVTHALDIAAESDVIVLCSSDRTRSLMLARTLIDLGLDDVVALDGGTLAWQLAGHALESGSRRRRVRSSEAGRQFAQLGAARLAKHFGVGRVEAAQLALLQQSAQGNFLAFDLRDGGPRAAAHVPCSVAVDSGVLIIRYDELIAVRDAPVMLVDDDAVRMLLTGVWLRRLGLPCVQTLAGGFDAWARANRPTRGVETPSGWDAASAVAPALQADEVDGWLAAHASAQVLHVDTGASYGRGHLPGATSLPRGWLETRVAALAPLLDAALLLTCAEGAQAAFAAAALRRRGYAHVAWLQGGTRAWAATGRALETASTSPAEDDGLTAAQRAERPMRDHLDH
jgi:rhodanese-related sulfurtransferase